MTTATITSPLAQFGGMPAITLDPGDMFHWPIVIKEDEDAVIDVMRKGAMSGTDITKQFEKEWAAYVGTEFALGACNGTAAVEAAMWACGVGAGDEIICPSMTYWACAAQAIPLGATVNFADISRETLCIDPADIEHRIGPKTRAIVVVHYTGYPCDMDTIMAIARKHGIKVIEDYSHAQGGRYKGRMVGSLGDIGATSMMGGKSFAIGEAGMITTSNRELYERAVAYGHYERTGGPSRYNPTDAQVHIAELQKYIGMPMGGCKHRMNQMCSAMGRVQLKYYPQRIAEIDDAMNRFWDLLDGVPGLRAHRPPKGSGSTMGGWYAARGLYYAEELGGVTAQKFCAAVRHEGAKTIYAGGNAPLHLHPYFHTADFFHQGQPTVLAFGQRDVRQGPGTLPVSESIGKIAYCIPWFKHDRPAVIAEYAQAFRKVAEHADQLRE